MKLTFLLILSFFVSCSSLKSPPTPEVRTPPVVVGEHSGEGSTPIGPAFPVPGTTKHFTVNIQTRYYEPAQVETVKKAALLLERVINSQEFKDLVVNHKVDGVKKFTSNLGLSNEQIYKKMFEGAEAWAPAIDYELDATLEMYYAKWSKVIGYTYIGDPTIYTNYKFHAYYSACEVGSNTGHEWLHSLSFSHESADEWSSVPYAFNTIFESLCDKAENNLLTPLK